MVALDGHVNGVNGSAHPDPNIKAQLKAVDNDVSIGAVDLSKLIIDLTDKPKELPDFSSLKFGQVFTDHMLVISFDPATGWSAPVIQPYQPLSLDPSSSCFQYCPNAFEGMKAYVGPNGEPRLFRPELNMKRLKRSIDKLVLPPVDTEAVLVLIKKLILLDQKWIPNIPGYSLYVRPTIIGTKTGLGVVPSTHALLYVIMSPSGPYFRTEARALSLHAEYEAARTWPGGTGEFKLALNYTPCFGPQSKALKLGYDQVLWLIGEERRISEVGAMNVFIAFRRDDGDIDLVTPSLDGTILPGITRASILSLASSHSPATPLPNVSPTLKIHTYERIVTMSEVVNAVASNKLLEVFGVGTAVVVAAVGCIGYEGTDIELPKYKDGKSGLGVVGSGLYEMIIEIQLGRVEWEGWSVAVE